MRTDSFCFCVCTKLSSTLPMIIEAVTISTILILVPFLITKYKKKISLKKICGLILLTKNNINKSIFYGFVVASLMLLISSSIGLAILTSDVVDDDAVISNTDMVVANNSFIALFFFLIISSVSEEIFFRGFLFQRMKHRGMWFTIIVTSLIFAFAHATYGLIFPIIMAFIIGVLLSYVVWKTKNLSSAIIAHTTYNLIVLFTVF